MNQIFKKDYVKDWQLDLIPDYLKKWANASPENDALINADTGQALNYRDFDLKSDEYALALKNLGLKKGDIVITQFLATPEFFFLVYGCLKTGIIISPIDIRLKAEEVVRDIKKVDAKAFFCPAKTLFRDFTEIIELIKKECPSVEHFIQWKPLGLEGEILESSIEFEDYFGEKSLRSFSEDKALKASFEAEYEKLTKRDPALIIFTTGTTGDPKPALICHENVLINNCVASRGCGLFGEYCRLLNVMPTSHIAGTAQGPMTAWFVGGSVATMSFFTPEKALESLEKYKTTFIGGVPTHFRMMWAVENYEDYDLSSLKFSLYGGSSVDTAFLHKLAKMSPLFGTAYGMTECGGFFSCTPRAISVDEMSGQVGQFFPELANVTIRKPMDENGRAGEILEDGEVGEICVDGSIVFLGYYNNIEATAKTISSEGILYTGDMGCLKDMGTYRAIFFSGRRKFVIKPKGYLVFPDEVSDFLTKHPKISQAQVVGVEHEMFTDGVFAFVQPETENGITKEEIDEYCKKIASYKRPLHIEFWSVGEQFPVNNVNKVNLLVLTEMAEKKVEDLRKEGSWDALRN